MADPLSKTVKGMDPTTWDKALACAKKRGQPLAEWLGRAIETQANVEAGDRVTLPDEQGKPEPETGKPDVGPGEIEALLRAAHAVSVASGVPIPKGATRHAFALLTSQLRAARGLPPVKPRQRNGQTRPALTLAAG